jgi:membrane protein implicated in regulation of membrane protease activity
LHVALGAYAVTGALLVIGWLCIHPDWKISVLLLFVVAFLFAVSLRNFESIRQKSQTFFGSQQSSNNTTAGSDD